MPTDAKGTHVTELLAGLQSARRSAPNQGHRPTREVKIMTRRIRKWLIAAITAVTTGFLVWLPTIAQAGIVATGAD